ncbi:phenylalanine--tRNA ligase subunit beta [Buchnera aphidicola (Muscaphis stroyani)]|uniref:Phenylalanine--tRNA ligase beta subunit n=1 Tax=Buchnera aphidicola (Muscaphis stroyani) TaxID=1241869 RepID=A0A4D6YF63_9GAMM|nr:phenylalanine--tRNA ligase subunit beta [Buchnera aphidicola]QCI24230.1 phenylalanine--tRNA ligase subunit beta [Buchnera aphidicola (Muscaphis stroyani)]
MKFSEEWLHQWVNPPINIDQLCDQMTDFGLEIEHRYKFRPLFQDVVVGKIVHCVPHFKSDKLKVTKVDVGSKDLLNIVCGATNCRSGIKVAVASVGAILPNNLKIKIKKIQNELSEGMICSFFELGIFNRSNTIIELNEKAIVGSNVNDYFRLKDNIIKISILPNQSDNLSILGIARNVAAINELSKPVLKTKNIVNDIKNIFCINIKDTQECLNYMGRIIKNVNIKIETPFWMKKKLFLCDSLSDNVIKNIISYVLIEIGQPLNVLNSDKISQSITIRMSKNKEEFFYKKNETFILNKNIIVISDNKKILSIPGNTNSYLCDFDNNCKNIFLSSYLISKQSIFDIIETTKINKILEYYKHGIDSEMQYYALEYATDLILKICGGNSGPIVIDKTNDARFKNKKIKMYLIKLNKISGIFIDNKTISNILKRLDYIFTFKQTYWEVIAPSWRFDILIEEDVINDILRIYGYNNIPSFPLKENLNIKPVNSKIKDNFSEISSSLLINKGYYEAITYGFVDPHVQNLIFPNQEKLLISNPISKDTSSMRLSLWPGLIKTVSYNQNRNQDSIRFFEIGLCFSLNSQKNLEINQDLFLGAAISGKYSKDHWDYTSKKVDFYDLKGDLECVFELICGLKNIEFRKNNITGLHPEQCASIYFQNNFIGNIGAIDPRLENQLNLNDSVFVFEICLDKITFFKLDTIEKISKFPISRRDISILISDNIIISDILRACEKFFIDKKVEINLFDVYSCTKFLNTQKSIGISFTFQDQKKTLKENEINLMIDSCLKELNKKFQVILRK